ncbi:MAG: enoyl-CoA hydratase/isomerase family protein [Bdellovibrionales bacterium]
MNQDILTHEIIAEVQNGVALITLNRPKALNALSIEMIRQISTLLTRWAADDAVRAVVFCGAGDRAFCAGGDVKAFYRSGMDYRRGHVDSRVPAVFFAEEYSLNKQIFHYPKPTIAFMDGITMGGGYGIAGHCKHRIATDKTVFAMPEVAIGFFPDVGAVYHLIKAPHHFGRYLALTGVSVEAGDMVAAGLADYYADCKTVEGVVKHLDGCNDIAKALSGFCDEPPAAALLSVVADEISGVFDALDLSLIFAKLREVERDWALDAVERLSMVSPLSVSVTARNLEDMAGADFETVIERDFRLSQHFIQYPDLYEGIRAVLIDRDQSPVWNPMRFNDIQAADIDRYFKPAEGSLADVRIVAG